MQFCLWQEGRSGSTTGVAAVLSFIFTYERIEKFGGEILLN